MAPLVLKVHKYLCPREDVRPPLRLIDDDLSFPVTQQVLRVLTVKRSRLWILKIDVGVIQKEGAYKGCLAGLPPIRNAPCCCGGRNQPLYFG